jgi:hypothetical protein
MFSLFRTASPAKKKKKSNNAKPDDDIDDIFGAGF